MVRKHNMAEDNTNPTERILTAAETLFALWKNCMTRSAYKVNPRKHLLVAFVVGLILILAGCAQLRHPVPENLISRVNLAGMPNVRTGYFQYNPDIRKSIADSCDCSFLALSGGGANGAFGAGVLCGWTQSGTRPNFQIVTGISTGALIAPFAFLGPDYDDKLKKGYTTIESENIFKPRGPWGILEMFLNESYAETKPLENLIKQLITEKEIAAIAKEYAKGRRLYIGTTNLDLQEFIIWDMGAIAASNNTESLTIFRKVMLASASIPGAFPPVYFDVETGGEKYDEMHVDGGVMVQVFEYGLLFETLKTSGIRLNKPCSIYVIMNNKIEPEYEPIPRDSLKIIDRSLSTLMKANSWIDLNRIYNLAQKDGVVFNYTSIQENYIPLDKTPFSKTEMNKLFTIGFDLAKNGPVWSNTIKISRKYVPRENQ
jgi:hypothetical protein